MYKIYSQKETSRKKHTESVKKRKQNIREEVYKIKDVPCMDCNIKYPPYVMDFDHRGDKKFVISMNMARYSLKTVREEISKCDIVCANCHRFRTYNRLKTG